MTEDVDSRLTEHALVTLLDQLPVPVSFMAASGQLVYVNQAGKALWGVGDEDLGRDMITLAVAPGDTAGAVEIMERVLAGKVWQGQYPVTRPDGTRHLGRFVAAPLADVGRGLVGMVSVELAAPDAEAADELAVAVGERALLAQAEEANLLLESILTSAPIGLAVFDRALRFVRVNAALAAMSGIPAEQHTGRHFADLFPALFEEASRDISSVFATGEAVVDREMAGEMPGHPGDRRTWVASYYPVRLRDDVLWVGAIVTDVTEQRRADAERSRLLQAERDARAAAERMARRLAHLQAVTAGLAQARTPEQVAAVVIHHGAEALGAHGGVLCMLAEDGERLEVVAHEGYAASVIDRYSSFATSDDLPPAEAVRTGEVVLLRSLDERHARYPSLRGIQANHRACAAVPLLVDWRPLGAIALGWREPREFSDDDRRFLVALGQQAAQALERARLHAAERLAAERQALLAEASRLLASSLDHRSTLAEFVRLAVPAAADACAVHLLDVSGLSLAASADVDPARQEVLAGLLRRPSYGASPRLLQVLRDGRSALLSEGPSGGWDDVGEDDEYLGTLRDLGIGELLVAPMRAHDRSVGVLVLGGAAPRRYGRADVGFAEDLAARAGVAVENARSHRARAEVARTLQRSLLPPKAPVVPGLELAARYHPVGDGSEVGGDFYDAFPVGDGRWGLVIGDVCGKGVLAASLTALARYTVRAVARRERSPAAVLEVLNRTILDHEIGDRFCTVLVAFVEPLADPVRITVASGGHPLPLVVAVNGGIRSLGKAGTGVGLFSEPTFHDESHLLLPGEVLVFYTDGLLEARSPEGSFADGLLERALTERWQSSAELIADGIERVVLGFQGGRPRDDMALLVLRAPARLDERLPPSPAAASAARRLLGSWLSRAAPELGPVSHDLLLAATELTTNAARVARTGLQLQAWREPDGLVLDVSDDGPGFDGALPPLDVPPDVHADRGRGLFIVRSLMDECTVQSGPSGTVVRCRKRL